MWDGLAVPSASCADLKKHGCCRLQVLQVQGRGRQHLFLIARHIALYAAALVFCQVVVQPQVLLWGEGFVGVLIYCGQELQARGPWVFFTRLAVGAEAGRRTHARALSKQQGLFCYAVRCVGVLSFCCGCHLRSCSMLESAPCRCAAFVVSASKEALMIKLLIPALCSHGATMQIAPWRCGPSMTVAEPQ